MTGRLIDVRRILGFALMPVLILLAIPTVARLLGDHGWPPLVILSVIVPYTLPLLIALLAVFAVLARGALAGIAGALVLLNVVWLTPLFVGHGSKAQGAEVTVLTVNLHLGQADPTDLVQTLKHQHVDVLAVQELTTGEAAALDRAGLKILMPQRVLAPGSGASGNGIYSRLPLSKLPKWQLTFAAPGAIVRVGGVDLIVRDVHVYPPLFWRPSKSQRDWAKVRAGVGAFTASQPAIVVGDFNASRDTSGLRGVMGHGLRDASEVTGAGFIRTWSPSHLPALLQLDHVLVNAKVRVRDFHVVDVSGSDHRAMLARLTV